MIIDALDNGIESIVYISKIAIYGNFFSRKLNNFALINKLYNGIK